ncbi:MAG TPA: polyphosphate polymerase domain-containing protein [Bacteroidia bacterium]|nr:polyphosphate polymerase domain-containing protein [Bacteroidia bacterium]
MDNVKLLDRVDTKFMFRESYLPELLEQMKKDYFVLEAGEKRYTHYETLYFDTEHFGLYLRHHNGKLNRFKFRSRKYVESNLHFFEVKFKNNKGRTVKDRIKRPEIVQQISDKSEELVRSISTVDPRTLHAKLWVNYLRMTFVNKHSQERLTIDTELLFKDSRQTVDYRGLVIAEVKQGSSRDKSPFIDLMRKYSILQKSISKYCLGVISLNPEIKKNNFKPTILYLSKLLK